MLALPFTVMSRNKETLPSIPAVIKERHRPTLIMKTHVELKEEREPGRYSIITERPPKP